MIGYDSATGTPLTDLASMVSRGVTHPDTVLSVIRSLGYQDVQAVYKGLQDQWFRRLTTPN